MHVLIAIALKSLLIAGLTLGLLRLMKRRSAAERSWVAHIGLLALIIMAFAPLALPRWNVEAPALFGRTPTVEATVSDSPPLRTVASAPLASDDVPVVAPLARPSLPSVKPAALAGALYALPAAILLFITALALARLIALRARADVLVDSHWLGALARAQRRMGFKHGTALLTSNELASPISWGLMRPVILLNERAVEASGEAEAIIAHELAHIARMDWVKLLLARLTTALFWFNPLVWLLAREAHQLREETADDAVLGADIVDTDYAQLLVGVARHECPGLLLGAHGVAPSKTSLARRVARVLDGKSVRGPAPRSFALGVFVGAVVIAAPLAAITLTPAGAANAPAAAKTTGSAAAVDTTKPYYASPATPTDLPHIIVSGVQTSVATVKAAMAVDQARQAQAAGGEAVAEARQAREEAVTEARQAREEALADAREAREDAIREAHDAAREARDALRANGLHDGHLKMLMHMKIPIVDPNYVSAMRAAQPRLLRLEPEDFAGMQAIGVTPAYARSLAIAGLPNLDADQLAAARAIGLSPDYVRGLAAAGLPPRVDDYVQLRAVGVPVHFVTSIRKSGQPLPDADRIVEIWAVGVRPGEVHVPMPPTPPPPPRTPVAPPRDPDDG